MRYSRMCMLLVLGAAFIAILPGYASEKKAINYTEIQISGMLSGDITPVGKRVRLRNVTTQWKIEASDSRISGEVISVFNGTFNADGSGPIWGTLQIGTKEAGWECTFTGEAQDYFRGKLNWIIKIVGHGIGEYEGLKLESTQSVDMNMFLENGNYATPAGLGVGEITDPTE